MISPKIFLLFHRQNDSSLKPLNWLFAVFLIYSHWKVRYIPMKKNVLPPETILYIATLEKQVATQKDFIKAQKDLIDAMQRQKE